MVEDYILQMQGITKIYENGFVANEKVNLNVKRGEIHALVGENGAGKTTLMKILFGIEKSEEGQIIYNGEAISIGNPIEAIERGIGMVHQHFMLVPSLTVTENVVLGLEPTKQVFIDFKTAVKETKEISDKYQLNVDPNARIMDLSVGLKQKVEILKALYRKAKLLILDEPTAVLTPQETQELFVQLKEMKKQGHTIIFISHKLQEVMELCDSVTILRLGKSIDTKPISEVNEAFISHKMVGRDVVVHINKKEKKVGKTILKARNVSHVNKDNIKVLDNVSFSLREGEILGVAGVEGNGQKELSELITGSIRLQQGSISILEENIQNKSINEIRELGVSYVPEDRMAVGVAGSAKIFENIISTKLHDEELSKGPFLNLKKIDDYTTDLVNDFSVKCDNVHQNVSMLSGGNVQKVVVAREFSEDAELSVINQPTRGIDIGAAMMVRNKIVELRDKGLGILMISADLNEILELSDSIIVMNQGEISAYIEDSQKIDETELGEYMLGIKKQQPEEIARVMYE